MPTTAAIQSVSATAVLAKAQREVLSGRLSNTTRASIKKMNLNANEKGIGDSLITGLSKSKVVASIASHGIRGIESAADILAASEVIEAGSVAQVAGGIMCCFPATLPLGLGLIAIGALSKIAARNIIPRIAKKFDKTVDHNAAAEQDYLNDVNKQIGEPLTLVMQLSDDNEALQQIQEKFEKAKSDFADGKLSLDEFKQEVKETIRATGDLGVTSYMNLAKLENQLEKIPTPTERIAEAQKSETSAEAEVTQEASARQVAPT